MPFLTGIFMWFERPENAWARYAIMIALALVGLKAWGSWKEQQGRDKQKAADAITTIKTVQKIERTSEHEAQVAIKAGESAPHVDSAGAVDLLPDAGTANRIFRD